MRKITALLLTALLLFSAAAYADSAAIDFRDRFEIRADLPDGWHSNILSQNDITLEGEIRADADDPTMPVVNVFISFNESYSEVNSLKDLGGNVLDLIRDGFSAENEVSFDTLTTDSGISLLVIRETGEDQDFLDFYTVWNGHEIELTLFAGEEVPGRTLTDEQVKKCISYVKTLEIGPVQ